MRNDNVSGTTKPNFAEAGVRYGDARFRKKSFRKMRELCGEDRTVVLVSHALGTIQELADQTLKGSFRHIDPTEAHVILLDAAPAVLPPMGEKLGLKAKARLEKMGVEIQLNAMVTDVDRNGITVKELDGTKVPERSGRALDHETEDAFERLRVAGYL